MRSHSQELLRKSTQAMVAAVEVYNKPDFRYREESVAVLMVNAWELLLKAKWLKDRGNRVASIYVFEPRKKKDGSNSKLKRIRVTRSGNPVTLGIRYLSNQLLQSGSLHSNIGLNLEALIEIRDSSVHFYDRGRDVNPLLSKRLQEICTASVRNYAELLYSWFGHGLESYDFYVMPLAFVGMPTQTQTVLLNKEEKNLIKFIDSLSDQETDDDSPYAISVNIDVRFTKSKEAKGDLIFQVVKGEKGATKVVLTEEQILKNYPWDYEELNKRWKKRFPGRKMNRGYHKLRKTIASDPRFGHVRYLDPTKPSSSRKPFYNPNILNEFEKH